MISTALRRTGASAFNPLSSITWHTAFWASDPNWSNPGNGGSVTTWPDGSGNGHTATTQAGTVTWQSASTPLNSQPVVRTASNGYLLTAAFTSLGAPLSAVIVFALNATSGTRIICDGGGNALTDRLTIYGDGSKFVSYAGVGITSSVSVDTSGHLAVGYFTALGGTNDFIRVGSTTTTGNAGTTSPPITKVSLGSRADGNSFINGDLAFYGLYQGNVTNDGQWTAFKTWANTTYGVTT